MHKTKQTYDITANSYVLTKSSSFYESSISLPRFYVDVQHDDRAYERQVLAFHIFDLRSHWNGMDISCSQNFLFGITTCYIHPRYQQDQ